MAKPHQISGLVRKGKAVQVMRRIAGFLPEQQTSVLSAPGAVRALASAGYTEQIIELMTSLTPESRTAILLVPGASLGLIKNGGSQGVMSLINALPTHQQQASVLSGPNMAGPPAMVKTITLLAEAGQSNSLIALLDLFPVDLAENVLRDEYYTIATLRSKAATKMEPLRQKLHRHYMDTNRAFMLGAV